MEIWRRGRESNPPKSDRQSGALPRELPRQILVLRPGIEPGSDAYKAPASPLMLTELIGLGDRIRTCNLDLPRIAVYAD